MISSKHNSYTITHKATNSWGQKRLTNIIELGEFLSNNEPQMALYVHKVLIKANFSRALIYSYQIRL